MKRTYLFCILLLSCISFKLFAQDLKNDTIKLQGLTVQSNGKRESINWLKISLAEATTKAKLTDKKILMYFTAKWCGPCRTMEQEVFPDYKVIRMVNDNYIALKIDVDAWGGKKWVEDFGVKGMPELFILNSTKQRLRHQLGALRTAEFIEFLNLKGSPADLKMLDTTHVVRRKEKWKGKVNLGVGGGFANLVNANSSGIFAYDIRLGYSLEKTRLSFNPSLNFTSIGSSSARLNYIRFPVQLALNFYRGSVLGLPGGYRLLAAPYVGRLLNIPNINANKNDLGFDYGLGIYIGDTNNASLEFSLRGSKGFTDVLTRLGNQTNQYLRASITLSIRKG